MRSAPSFADPAAGWRSYAAEREIRIDPRHPKLARLVERTPLARLVAAFRPTAMRPVDLDFHPRRISGPGLGLLLAGLLLALAALADYRDTAAKVEHWRGELARREQAPAAAPDAGRAEESAARQQAAAAVTQGIRRPWEKLFAALEAAQGEDIAVLALDPDAARGTLQISGEGRNRAAILAYIERLSQSPALANVFLLADQQQQQDPDKPFRFTLAADWRQNP